uniref:Uncharacterized protein n=1 Tax=Megaselia scalaris TaxID=36166 RepID=T1GK83_MEGSC
MDGSNVLKRCEHLSTKVIGLQKPRRASVWRVQEHSEAVSKTRKSKLRGLSKRSFEKQQFEDLRFMRDRNQASKLYQNVNKERKNYTPVGSSCKDRNANLITNRKEILMRWEEFSSDRLMTISRTSKNRLLFPKQ